MSYGQTMKVVFEDGGWKIHENEDSYWNMDFDVVTHDCAGWWTNDRVMHAWDMMNRTHCKGCSDAIPESIVGLWKLKNMGQIQRNVGTEEFYRAAFEYEAPKSI